MSVQPSPNQEFKNRWIKLCTDNLNKDTSIHPELKRNPNSYCMLGYVMQIASVPTGDYSIARAVKDVRKKYGLTRKQLGKKLGVSKKTIKKLESISISI